MQSFGTAIGVARSDEDPGVFRDDLAAKTPDMSMIDLRAADRTLIVGTYRSIGWPSAVDWIDR